MGLASLMVFILLVLDKQQLKELIRFEEWYFEQQQLQELKLELVLFALRLVEVLVEQITFSSRLQSINLESL